mgnify:CR=1 FL=1
MSFEGSHYEGDASLPEGSVELITEKDLAEPQYMNGLFAEKLALLAPDHRRMVADELFKPSRVTVSEIEGIGDEMQAQELFNICYQFVDPHRTEDKGLLFERFNNLIDSIRAHSTAF